MDHHEAPKGHIDARLRAGRAVIVDGQGTIRLAGVDLSGHEAGPVLQAADEAFGKLVRRFGEDNVRETFAGPQGEKDYLRIAQIGYRTGRLESLRGRR